MLAFNPKNQDLAVISFIEGRLSSIETLSTTLLFLSITPDLPHQWLRVFGRPIFRPTFAYVCAITAATLRRYGFRMACGSGSDASSPTAAAVPALASPVGAAAWRSVRS